MQTRLLSPKYNTQPTASCLFVLTETETSDFFGDTPLQDLFKCPCQVHRTSIRTSDALRETILELRPDVIVGAWNTPHLPLIDNGLPVPYYCHLAGSIRSVVSRELLERGLMVTNWGTAVSRYVAEAALMLALSTSRNLGLHYQNFHVTRGWRCPTPPAWSLFQRRIGIHGFGNISKELVRLLAPFQGTISIWDPFAPDSALAEAGVQRAESLEALFSSSEYLFECCALTPETQGIVDRSMLDRLPEHAVFVNIARGKLVDERALAERVRQGRIRVGLDVFSSEPYPESGLLRGLDAIVVMPHLGGNTVDSRRRAGACAMSRIHEYLSGQPPTGLVSLALYDRMT